MMDVVEELQWLQARKSAMHTLVDLYVKLDLVADRPGLRKIAFDVLNESGMPLAVMNHSIELLRDALSKRDKT